MKTRKPAVSASLLCSFVLAAMSFMSCALHAQTYPSKPIKLVVPNAPGGGSDTVARLIAEKVGPGMGQAIVVENRAGAGGRLAGEYVANAAPDGYTLLMGTDASLITAKALFATLNYDPIKSFAPVSAIASTSYVLIAHPTVPASNVAQLIAVAKAHPGKLTYASTGSGSPAHLSAELFQSLAGVKLVHVPYKGSSPGTLSVIQGETDLMFSNFVAAVPYMNSGRIRVLGISSPKRSSLAPNIPTIAESGLPGFEVQQVYGVVAPANTPPQIIKRLSDEFAARFPTPETRKILEAQGTEVALSTPEQFGREVAHEIDKWTAIVKKAGIKPE